jgi:uncharacterized membrane protein YjjB (DUF3815 family)
MTLQSCLVQFVLCFAGTASACILFNVPRNTVILCGTIGVLGWFTAIIGQANGFNEVASVFVASLLVAVAAEVAARVMRIPAFCFTVPGVIPLVPGVAAYNAMLAFVTEQHQVGTEHTVHMLLVAAAIAAGLGTAGSLFRAIPQRQIKKRTDVEQAPATENPISDV